jgi:uncharacterized damage-inducible protein DinB
MNLEENLITELRNEAATTRRVLERVPPASLGWKPHAKSRTLGEIATHIVTIPGLFLAPLDGDEFSYDAYSGQTDTVPAILATWDRNIARALETLGGLSEERLLAPWRFRYGGRVIFDRPRHLLIRSVALNHLIHHRGQLTVYLRLLDVPVPPIYGPTADETHPPGS